MRNWRSTEWLRDSDEPLARVLMHTVAPWWSIPVGLPLILFGLAVRRDDGEAGALVWVLWIWGAVLVLAGTIGLLAEEILNWDRRRREGASSAGADGGKRSETDQQRLHRLRAEGQLTQEQYEGQRRQLAERQRRE